MNSKLLSALLLCATPLLAQEVHMKSVTEKIPTYQIGAPEIDPIFFTGRVYQGYLQPIITQYFIDNKSEIWLLFLIAHSKR